MANEPAPLDCVEFVEIATEYLEGAMAPAEALRFETHLAACTGCATYMAQLRTTLSITGRLEEEAIAPPMRDRLLAAFRDWRAGR